MNCLYSLYDALVSIDVPSEKARAVVDAMERDMGTGLATKQDLQTLATGQELLVVKQNLQLLKQELKQDLKSLMQDVEGRFVLIEQKFASKIDSLEMRMVLKLGSMLILGFGLVIGALSAWT